MTSNDFDSLLEKIRKSKEIENKVNSYGGFNTKIIQSDKIGFNWEEEYLGEKLIKQTYVEQDNPVGVRDNPFNFELGCQLIPNAFYRYNDKIYVYVNDEIAIANDFNAEDFEEM